MPVATRDWFWSPVTVEVARVLLASEPATRVRTDEISQALQRDSRAVRGFLADLHAAGLVTRVKLHTGSPGHPAYEYSLTQEQRVEAQGAVDTPPENRPPRPTRRTKPNEPAADSDATAHMTNGPSAMQTQPRHQTDGATMIGRLARGQELVFVDVSGSAIIDVLELLLSTELSSHARWTALIGDELVFAFDGRDPVQSATDLLAVMAGARLSVRRATVTRVGPTDDLVEQAGRTVPAVRRARMTRDAYDGPQ